MVPTPPRFFSPSHPLLLSGLPISSSPLSPTLQPTPTYSSGLLPLLPAASLPFLSLSLPPPIPPSQLPVELAAVQDSADGSVIRSASLRSLSASPLFFSLFFFSLCNQITEGNFGPFGLEILQIV